MMKRNDDADVSCQVRDSNPSFPRDAGINVRIDVTDRCKVLKQDPCPAGQCFRGPLNRVASE